MIVFPTIKEKCNDTSENFARIKNQEGF